ncbi:hypothetical protein AA23498_2188 [Acetobacter nitrogenifigens DSM 23921 = NBRC 105050]|uniref:Uncharacterized protein n=1 Tax=Acetobacter nitrogenifigens DSM 23921 = NBRC 105050 TaxID=1120919 RepID=A0A511X6X7_9PROT|nr:hypothetical protein AA23498_2188 [Acetobacter nitrogenifigens DSM 23921 = NBRC 105050]GEN58692.1 hypothetical protein ANI02nite_05760 [Acetobacter nitrogenifigens DSM 23921 = NBRC 105050]
MNGVYVEVVETDADRGDQLYVGRHAIKNVLRDRRVMRDQQGDGFSLPRGFQQRVGGQRRIRWWRGVEFGGDAGLDRFRKAKAADNAGAACGHDCLRSRDMGAEPDGALLPYAGFVRRLNMA